MGWIKYRWDIAKQNPLFWVNLALIVVTWVVIFAWPGAPGTDLLLRVWAMLLQLGGAYTVWSDLSSAARAFDRPPVCASNWKWLKTLIAPRRPVVLQASGSSQTNYGIGGRIKQRMPIGATGQSEARIAALEFNLHYMDADIDTSFNLIAAVREQASEEIWKEREVRAGALAELGAKLKDSAVGSYNKLVTGLSSLAVGVILSSLAPEIVKLVACHWGALLGSLTHLTVPSCLIQ